MSVSQFSDDISDSVMTIKLVNAESDQGLHCLLFKLARFCYISVNWSITYKSCSDW